MYLYPNDGMFITSRFRTLIFVLCLCFACIYMRVFLFGLSRQRTNPMDPTIEFIQLVLPTSTYNTFSLVHYMLG